MNPIPAPFLICAKINFPRRYFFLDQATSASFTLTAVPNVPPRRTDWPGRIWKSERTRCPHPGPSGHAACVAHLVPVTPAGGGRSGRTKERARRNPARDVAGFFPARAAYGCRRGLLRPLRRRLPAQGIVDTLYACVSGPQHEGATLASTGRWRTAGQTDWPTGETGMSTIGNVNRQPQGAAACIFRQAGKRRGELCAFPKT